MTDVSVTLRGSVTLHAPPKLRASTWCLHTKLYKFGRNTFLNIALMNNRTGLNFGEVVYISTIYHIPDLIY